MGRPNPLCKFRNFLKRCRCKKKKKEKIHRVRHKDLDGEDEFKKLKARTAYLWGVVRKHVKAHRLIGGI